MFRNLIVPFSQAKCDLNSDTTDSDICTACAGEFDLMQPTLPLLFRAGEAETARWMNALDDVLGHLCNVKLFPELTKAERESATMAIVANPDPKDIAALPNLVWMQSLWAGVERLAAELPMDGPGIVRMTDPQMAATMSEAVLAWTLYLHRDMPRYARLQQEKTWQELPLKTPAERTVGMLGLGNLGSKAAKRLSVNGFNVKGWSRSPAQIEGIETYHGPDGFQAVLSVSDILVILVPLTAETRSLLNEEALTQMPQGASIINFARGPIIDDEALLKAVDKGQIGHAVLDVFAIEPLPSEHPYWSHPSVTVLPHISAPTIVSTAVRVVASNIKTYLETGNIPPCVDRQRGY